MSAIRAATPLAVGVIALLVGLSVSHGSAASLALTSQNLTPYRTCTIAATPTTTTAVTDATVSQASASTNFGTATTLLTSSATSANQRIYVRFDLTLCNPVIPASATIRLATLRLYLTGVPAACRTLDVFRTAAAWAESTLTWNNQPFGTTLNNPASGSRTASIGVGTPAGCANQAAGYVAGGTVTTDVAAFVAGTATNYGWMLRDDVESSSTTRTATFSAKNLGTIAQVPELIVTWVAVP
ncbi:MAG TPA: DNRLRE domain-containing protein [Candidatus Limnocylindrales bacterium]|nr:DNRLRE domain-containing protein [Candidatus Limnocylindrales bacterium]